MPYLDTSGQLTTYPQERQRRTVTGAVRTRSGLVLVKQRTTGPGVGGIVTDILIGTGLKDPIAHYAPGMSLGQVWTKYSEKVDRYRREVPGLRSETARRELLKDVEGMYRIMEDIRTGFEAEGVIGDRERKKLGALVSAVEKFRGKWHEAKKKYGWAPPAPEEVPIAPPALAPLPPAAGLPWGWIAGGLFLLLAVRR